MITHQEYQIKSRYNKLRGYGEQHGYHIVSSGENDTFVSNVMPISCNEKFKLNILYAGLANEIPEELFDNLFQLSDSSENPLRPFRWYRPFNGMSICVNTNSGSEIQEGRDESLNRLLSFIGHPEAIWIYELI
jgi:hypothetical protein